MLCRVWEMYLGLRSEYQIRTKNYPSTILGPSPPVQLHQDGSKALTISVILHKVQPKQPSDSHSSIQMPHAPIINERQLSNSRTCGRWHRIRKLNTTFRNTTKLSQPFSMRTDTHHHCAEAAKPSRHGPASIKRQGNPEPKYFFSELEA